MAACTYEREVTVKLLNCFQMREMRAQLCIENESCQYKEQKLWTQVPTAVVRLPCQLLPLLYLSFVLFQFYHIS